MLSLTRRADQLARTVLLVCLLVLASSAGVAPALGQTEGEDATNENATNENGTNENGTSENYGDPEFSCAAFGEFAHEIGPRAPIEMKLAQ